MPGLAVGPGGGHPWLASPSGRTSHVCHQWLASQCQSMWPSLFVAGAQWPPVTMGLPTFASHVELAFSRARWPECRVSHDPRGWIRSANGWTSMCDVPPLENKHIAWRARENTALALHLQTTLERVSEVVMPSPQAWGLLCANLVAAWPDIKCP